MAACPLINRQFKQFFINKTNERDAQEILMRILFYTKTLKTTANSAIYE